MSTASREEILVCATVLRRGEPPTHRLADLAGRIVEDPDPHVVRERVRRRNAAIRAAGLFPEPVLGLPPCGLCGGAQSCCECGDEAA